MTDMTYEGWSNRETWATNLHLANDEGLYHLTLEQAARCLVNAQDEGVNRPELHSKACYALADVLKDQFAEWEGDIVEGSDTTEGLRQMILDIGSLYRVDWDEIAEHWVDDAIEIGEAS